MVTNAERDGADLSIALKGNTRRLFKAIQVAAGTVPEPAPVQTLPPTVLQAPAPATPRPAAVDNPAPLDGVIVQSGELKVASLTREDVDAAFANYELKRG